MSNLENIQSPDDRAWFDAYQGVRTLVLGASGFIGRWVARLLSQSGADLLLGVRNERQAAEIFQDFDVDGRMVRLDLNDMNGTVEQIKNLQPTITFNLAGYGVSPSQRDEVVANQINFRLVAILCEVLAGLRNTSWRGQDLVHVGSALEYGEIRGDLSEDSTPNPTTLYGKSKLAATQALCHYCESSGLRGVTARLFTVYGPGERDPGRLLPSLLQAAECHEPLSLTAGLQTRDFTYVRDVAEGLLRLGTASAHPGEVVNLTTGHLHTVRFFAESAAAIAQIPSSNLKFGKTPVRREEMSHDNVTVARLEQLLGWRPCTTISDGIRMTMEFPRNSRMATQQ